MAAISLLLVAEVAGQRRSIEVDDADVPQQSAAHLFSLGIGADLPFGDLADRFGTNNKISGGYQFLTSTDWLLGADISFYYGDNVVEDVLAPLRNQNAIILSAGEAFTNVILRQRGTYMGLEAGKIFPIKRYYRSGIKTSFAVGVLEHRIRLVDNSQNVLKVAGDRKKGYDRLTRGVATKQVIAYHHLSSNRRINYSIGFEFVQGFTSGVRAIDWDTGLPPSSGRLDLMVGIKAVWILPFWSGRSSEDIFY